VKPESGPPVAPRRGIAAGPLIAVVTLVAAIILTNSVGLVVRDPDHVAALYLLLVGAGVAGLVGLDIVLRARALSQRFPPSREAMRRVRRERWTLKRSLVAGSALAGFYVTYMAYRNLKAIVPLVRPHVNFDPQLADLDRSLFGGGTDPAILLHRLLGDGIPTHILSTAYVAFIVFLPLTIGVSLAFARELQAAICYTAAQSINWILGAISYFLLPSLGPAYADPGAFAALPYSEVTRLQGVLLDQRVAFLHDPASSTPQSIAAFASLHISMSFTAALAAHLLGAGRRLKIALWVWLAITCVGTVYLGWHYVLDDVAGVAMGALALAIAVPLTGVDLKALRGRQRAAPIRPSGVPSAEPVR
jgi:membrane-associated phospholipid phosphatase